MNLDAFKAYDIRGRIGYEITDELVYKIGLALGNYLNAKSFVIGRDVRLTSKHYSQLLAKGLTDAGVDVIDIGITGTEEVYFATSFLETDGGVEITASHNPKDYNGFKVVKKNSVTLGYAEGLKDIKYLIESNKLKLSDVKGRYVEKDLHNEYIDKILSFVDFTKFINPLKLLINVGNGTAGRVINSLAQAFKNKGLPIEFIIINGEADGNFPNGVPNPLLKENRKQTTDAILKYKADIGIAFDGDFDRCFFFDQNGRFIDGYYVVGLLAKSFLDNEPRQKIVYEPRLVWNTQDIVAQGNGVAIMTQAGHSFIKKALRDENAVYGGEMSAHHYFRDYYYCDSGMIAFLKVIELLQTLQQPISSLVDEMFKNYPVSGEISFVVENSKLLIEKIKNHYSYAFINEVDGLSVEFENWRFNLRSSNTEPYIRLNLETRANEVLLQEKISEVQLLIEKFK